MTQADEPRRESIVGLARRLVSGFVQLGRLEVTRGRQEIGQMLEDTRSGLLLIGVAVALLAVALMTVDVVIILGVAALFQALGNVAVTVIVLAGLGGIVVMYVAFGGELLGSLPPGARLALVAVFVLVAAGFAVPVYLGFRANWHSALFVLLIQTSVAPLLISRGVRKMRIGPPEETIEAVKEDVEWAKRLLRRG